MAVFAYVRWKYSILHTVRGLTRDLANAIIAFMQLTSMPRQSTAPWVIALLACSLAAFGAGVWCSQPGKLLAASGTAGNLAVTTSSVSGLGALPPSEVAQDVNFQEFWDLWKQLKDRYYKQPLDEKKMMYGAMSGMVASLGDPYTLFFNPTDATSFSEALQGKFSGIGAEIGIKDNQLQVIAPLPDSPAEKAGIRSGDFILAIDKQDTAGMSVDQAVSLIRGDKDTKVALTIGRLNATTDAKGKTKTAPTSTTITIVRDEIVVKSVTVAYKNNLAIVTVNHFNQDTDTLFQKVIDEVLTKNVKGIVLDMRNDPGGYLDRAIAVASEWTGEQTIVSERRQGKIVDSYKGTHPARLDKIKTVVLVNQGSASASEIVAGALQDYGLATLVGMKTFGKGSVQDYSEFSDKSALKVTIAEWLTPKDRSINKIGIQPDVQVDRTDADYNADRDPQLDKAVQLLTGKASAAIPAQATSTATVPSSN